MAATAATSARGLRPPNDDEPVDAQFERRALNAAEQAGNVARQAVVDIADEAQRDVIIFRVDPARARQTATHHRQRLGDARGYFQTGKQTGHDTLRLVVGDSQRT